MIDAHQHFFYPTRVAYPDIERHMAAIHRTITPDDLQPQLVAAGVEGTVLVQAANDLAETALLLGRRGAARLGAGGRRVDAARRRGDDDGRARRGGRARTSRRAHAVAPRAGPARGSSHRRLDALRVLAQRGLVYDLVTIVKGHLDNAPVLLDAVPELTVVIDHLGSPHVRGDRWEPWASLMREAAQHPNCVVKFCGLDPLDDGTVDAWRRYVDHVFEQFGPQRVMWASNWPATRMGATARIARSWRTRCDSCQPSPPAEIDAVLGGNAERIYRI